MIKIFIIIFRYYCAFFKKIKLFFFSNVLLHVQKISGEAAKNCSHHVIFLITFTVLNFSLSYCYLALYSYLLPFKKKNN